MSEGPLSARSDSIYRPTKRLRVESTPHGAGGDQRNAIRAGPNVFVAHTQPGFEGVAQSELAAVAGGFRALGRRIIPGRNGIILFAAGEPESLNRLRAVEDLFALVGYRRALYSHLILEQARGAARATPLIDPALSTRARMTPSPKGKRGHSFRVVVRIAGQQPFRRSDLQRAVERGVLERTDHRWRLADDQEGAIEFWATLIDRELFLALRLSDRHLRHREYQLSHRPAALRPAVGAALAWLSEPRPQDIVMDPLCGTATILVERAHLARHRLLLGADNSLDAICAAQANLGPRHKPWQLARWDATALALRDRCIDKIVTNLPWGKKLGGREQNQRLYPRLLAEFRRVTKREGLIVILSGETRLMAQLIREMKFQRARSLPVQILGARAAVYVLRPW